MCAHVNDEAYRLHGLQHPYDAGSSNNNASTMCVGRNAHVSAFLFDDALEYITGVPERQASRNKVNKELPPVDDSRTKAVSDDIQKLAFYSLFKQV